MKEIPVDATRFTAMVLTVLDVVPVMDNDPASPTNGQQKSRKDGLPTWEIQLVTKDPTALISKPETTMVKTWGHVQPSIKMGDSPVFENLTGFVWSGDNGGGVSLRCESVTATSAVNGSARAKSDKVAA